MRIVNFIGVSGERHSILIDEFGFPDFWTTKWVVEKLRKTGQASNTIAAKLHAVHCLYRALPVTADLSPRLAQCEWINVAEADHLLDQMAYPTQQIEPFGGCLAVQAIKKKQSTKVMSLEKIRSKLTSKNRKTIKANSRLQRLLFANEFLSWRANEQILHLRGGRKLTLAEKVNEIDDYLNGRTAKFQKESPTLHPKGLSQAQQELLQEVIQIDSPRNPWRADTFIRSRNQLIVELLLAAGPRRGAVLGLQIDDVDPMTGRVKVVRRKDDPDDPRPVETGNKRRDYQIALNHRILRILKTYQIHRHKVIVKVKSRTKHLVVSAIGRALEQSSLNYIIRALRAIPELKNIHPHLLRHTWASNYVRDRVADGVDLDIIERDLRTLGGWSEKSTMPSLYTSQYRDESAYESSLKLQEKGPPMVNVRNRK